MSVFDDITGLAVVGAVGFIGYEYVKNKNAIANAAKAVVNTATNANQGVSWQVAGAAPGDYCAAIASWRTSSSQGIFANGIFGIGKFDPNDWNAFLAYLQTIGVPSPGNPPSCWYGPYGQEGY